MVVNAEDRRRQTSKCFTQNLLLRGQGRGWEGWVGQGGVRDWEEGGEGVPGIRRGEKGLPTSAKHSD